MLSILFAFLTTCAFSMSYELLDTAEIGALMPEHSVIEELSAFLPVFGKRMYPQCILLFILFLFLYRTLIPRIRPKQFSVSALLTAAVFSFCLLAGECGSAYKDLSAAVQTVPQCVLSGLKAAGYLTLFYVTVRAGFAFLDGTAKKPVRGRYSVLLFEKHSFLLPLVIILVFWLPYLIAFYPGFVPSDGLKQLNNFFGSGNFTDNHPAFSSMMMGWAMQLGRGLGSDNLGVFLFTGPQMLVNALVMAACFPLFKELKSPVRMRKLTLAGFALIPVWPNYSYSLLKDSYYMAMILLFVIHMIRILSDPEKYFAGRANPILLSAALCLMMLVRHEGQYVGGLIFLTLFTLPAPRRHWKKLLPVLLIPLCVTTVFNRVIRPALNIDDSPAREALTMPIRQTSAVVAKMEDSLTDEESAVLHELFEYDNIAELFPVSLENADPLKGQFDPWASRDALLRYLKVWAALGVKHPLTYLNVFLCSNTRYYDPFLGPHRDIYGWFGIEQADYVNKGLFDIHYLPASAALRSALTNFADGLPRLPLTSLVYSLGASAWLMIFCLASLLRKKVRGVIIPLLPGLATFIMIQHSAINGFFRYMLPLLITLPLICAWTVYTCGREK
ncbi:MAG: hypothetical protein IKP86_00180 [Anaerolineaceae bacterium]|nr:hypothetical protein [Anaerolineaceae bacterium]